MMSPSLEHLGGGREGLVMRLSYRVDELPARRAQEGPLARAGHAQSAAQAVRLAGSVSCSKHSASRSSKKE